MRQIYDNFFYEEQSPYSIKSAKKIVPYLSKLFPDITSVVDVGCGIGAWLNEWKQEGKTIMGIDGNDLSEKDRKILDSEYIKHDLNTKFPKIQKKYDFCMSLEVAEHLSRDRAVSFINDLCSYSDIVLFSAAIPGQTGVNHINEQWPQYWANIFSANGYKSRDILRDYFWNDNDVAWWYSQNMILYINNTIPNPQMLQMGIFNEQTLSRIHPKCFAMYYNPVRSSENLSNMQKIKKQIKKILHL